AEAVGRSAGRYVRPTWDSIYEALAEAGRIVVAIDEFTYWVEEDESVLSELQRAWDERLSRSGVFLILLSSTVSLVEESISYGGGLYGRRTAQIKLGPLGPHHAKLFLPYKAEDLAAAYAITNGVPHYLSLFDRGRPLEDNIKRLFSRWGPLYEEVENLLRYEVREPHMYLNIVRAIEEGATTYSEIADRAKIPTSTLGKYLHVLEKLNIVRREVPVMGKARPIYVVADLYVKFWIRYIYNKREAFELGETPSPDLDRYMASAYEEIVRRSLPRLFERGVVPHLGRCGRYWEKDVEVDIVCIGDGGLLAIEVKWADLDEREVEEELRELKRKLGNREWTYLIAARRAEGGSVIQSRDIFEVGDNRDL
ncbi:MAG: ATP-binding protein, partial [Thermoproteus sp.]